YCYVPTPHQQSFPTRRSSDLFSPVRREKHRPGRAHRSGGNHAFFRAAKGDSGGKQRLFPKERRTAGGLSEKSGPHSFLHLRGDRSEEHTSELQSRFDLVCRLL